MFFKICSAIVPLFLSASVASAQVSLELKYSEGTKFAQQTDEKSSFLFDFAGMKYESNTNTFSVTTTTVDRRVTNGSLKLVEKVDPLQSETVIPGGVTQRFDSTNADKKADIPDLEPLLNSLRIRCLAVTVELDSKNNVTGVSLPNGEFEKLPDSAKEEFKAELLRKSVDRLRAYLPDEPVKMGDTWERSEAIVDSGHEMTFRTKYEYAGTVTQDGKVLDKIIGKALDVNYTIQAKPEVSITVENTKVTESESTYLFDRELGALVSRTSKVRIGGPMTIVTGGMTLVGIFEITMEEKAIRQK
jgi:hypothetical protein